MLRDGRDLKVPHPQGAILVLGVVGCLARKPSISKAVTHISPGGSGRFSMAATNAAVREPTAAPASSR